NKFKNDEWSNWLRSKIIKNSLTITEHKKRFLNARPEWAKTFSERHISITNSFFSHILDRSATRSFQLYRLEREIVEGDMNSEMAVERICDMGGYCKQTTVIYPEQDGIFTFRQENWISKGKWIVTKEFSFQKPSGFYTDSEFIRSILPWGETLEK
ncbi:hypothetical protein DRH13_01460, partial [Candidatus Woesebacteria bacterium]